MQMFHVKFMLSNCKVIVIKKCTMYFTICKAIKGQKLIKTHRRYYFILLAVICRDRRPPTDNKKPTFHNVGKMKYEEIN